MGNPIAERKHICVNAGVWAHLRAVLVICAPRFAVAASLGDMRPDLLLPPFRWLGRPLLTCSRTENHYLKLKISGFAVAIIRETLAVQSYAEPRRRILAFEFEPGHRLYISGTPVNKPRT